MREIRELLSLEGRVAIVTGGAGHIGSALCAALAEVGAKVVIIDNASLVCKELTQNLTAKYEVETLSIVVDLADELKLREVPDKILNRFGRIDILVNCAAFVGTSELEGWVTSFENQTTETWRQALEVNLTACFVLIQACTPALKRSGCGSIINIGSIYGLVGPDMRIYEGTEMGNPAAYASSKGALIQFTRWLSTVLAPEIRVNAISPGGVWGNQPETFSKQYINRTPLQRMATEEDMKGAIVYLASDLSSYVTGQNIIIDGGWTAW